MRSSISIQNFCMVLLALLFFQCQPIYFPIRQNIPMHEGKHELQGSVSVINGLNVQVAYSLSDHVGVTANYLYANNKGDSNSKKEYRTQTTAEIGLGYFKPLKVNWQFELYSGVGLGRASAHGYDIDALMFYFFPLFGKEFLVEGSYKKIFIQPAIGYKEDNVLSSLSVNCSRIDFTHFAITADDVKYNTRVKPQIFITPAATIQWSFSKNISGLMQLGYAFGLGDHPQYEYQSLVASVGLLAKIKVKK